MCVSQNELGSSVGRQHSWQGVWRPRDATKGGTVGGNFHFTEWLGSCRKKVCRMKPVANTELTAWKSVRRPSLLVQVVLAQQRWFAAGMPDALPPTRVTE